MLDRIKIYLLSHERSVVVWITLAGLGIRLLLFILFGGFFAEADTRGFTWPAHALLTGEPFDHFPRATGFPSYIGFIAGALWLLDYNYRWVVLLQHILGVLSALFLFGAFRILFPKAVILSYVLLLALLFDKHLIFWEHFVQAEGLFVFLGSSVVLLLALWGRKPSVLKSVLLGVVLGLFSLCRPLGIVFIPIVLGAVWIYLVRRHAGGLNSAAQLLSLLAPALLIVGGWAYRNYVAHGHFGLSGPHATGSTLYSAAAQFIDYRSPLHADLKERLRPILTEGYAEMNRQLALGRKRFDVKVDGVDIFNWVVEGELREIVLEYARKDLVEKGVPESEFTEQRIQLNRDKIREDLAFEAVRTNGSKYLTQWVIPEFFTLFLSHTSSPYSFLEGARKMERFYNTLIPEGHTGASDSLLRLHRRVLEGKRYNYQEFFEIRNYSFRPSSPHGRGPIWTAPIPTWHKVLLVVDRLFFYAPFPFSAILGLGYFGALFLLLLGLFRPGAWGSIPEVLWAIMLFPIPYALTVAALSISLVRFVVPIEPFLWFAAMVLILRVRHLRINRASLQRTLILLFT